MSYLLGLCYKIQCSMLDELQDIGHSVGTVKLDVALLVIYKCLIAFGLETLPDRYKIVNNANV